nr:uncharacterized mitochondrial protein AtMg00810-like [Tanacetum cinerariifolium]
MTKPHNKTPYELLLGRSPSIGFMRPFGYPVIILNTLDPLEKFDGKANKGFLVGYSVNSKAFRVFNRNQSNHNAGIKENLDADPQNTDDDVADVAFDVKENDNDAYVSTIGSDKSDNKKHDAKAKRDDKGKSHVDSLTGVRDLRAEFEEFSFNSSNRVNAVSASVNAVGLNSTNSSNSFTTASPSVNAASLNFRIDKKSSFVVPSKYPDDPDMPELQDIDYSDDEEDVGAEADLSNLETNIHVSPIPTTRVHKDHHVNQIIGALNSAPQTRSMTRMVKEQGLQVKQKDDGIFISQDKYVVEILRKFGFTYVKSASTPTETEKPLLKDPDGEDVDVHTYRLMIGSLMYLTSSRLAIMFAVCACVRFQVTPKVSHLHAVKRIFRYLKGKPHLGLWCPRDFPFNLVAYSDSDYVGDSLDRKSTTGGCQFLGFRLISWQCKKQTAVATSLTEAEYIDYLDEFYGPFIPIHILDEERIRREHTDYINRMKMLFIINPRPHHPTNDNTNVKYFSSLPIPIQESDSHQDEIDVVSITDDVLPLSVDNDDSDEEVDVVDVLRVDNFIQNYEHEYSESKDSDFDNPPLPLPPPKPPDKGFDFEIKILVVRSVIVKFCAL